ncbi:Cell number regulator 11 [Auxenochlorella protothecoides]|uniref:Cell number regulator 11 n=1 Tax=Auxenochlorella protothecoides TaxID=3075 RepID=A0A087SLW0_AUXPR|nr:Cell number regulator 11 [Auxenochlorella protothecoides]KFM26714.1 Cell number regulator 11 [Auxenochlorella protothecoides]
MPGSGHRSEMAEASPDSGHAESAPILSGDDESSLEEWNTGLFDCWEDCHLTAEGLCCPQCLHADNATRIDRFATCCPYQCSYMCLSALLLCSLVGGHHRKELRHTFSLPESPCSDHMVHCFCSCCALCQEAREIKPAPRLAAGLARTGQPPEVQHMARTYSHGLSLEEWEWDAAGGKVGLDPGTRRSSKATSVVAPKAKAIRRSAMVTRPSQAGSARSASADSSGGGLGSSGGGLSGADGEGVGEEGDDPAALEAHAGSLSFVLTQAAVAAAQRIQEKDRQEHAAMERRLERARSSRRERME